VYQDLIRFFNAASLENKVDHLNSTNFRCSGFRWTNCFNIAFNKMKYWIRGGQTEVIDGTKKRTIGLTGQSTWLNMQVLIRLMDDHSVWCGGNVVESYSASLRTMNGRCNTWLFWRIDLYANVYGNWFIIPLSYSIGKCMTILLLYMKVMVRLWVKSVRNWIVGATWWYHASSAIEWHWFVRVQDTNDLQDGSYIRLRNIQLGYTLPTALLSKARIKTCRIYVMGTNLATFSKFNGLDPEQLINGVDSFNYPNPRTVSFGIDLGF
jgi:hypothetical protein